MKSPEEIEIALQRLIPTALGERAQRNVSKMIAELSSTEPKHEATVLAPAAEQIVSQPIASTSNPNNLRIWGSVAAAIALALVPMWHFFGSSENAAPLANQSPVVPPTGSADAVLIDRMFVTDNQDVAGLVTSSDGAVLQQIKRKVHTRERYRTEKSGYLITISESRAEKVFIPKNSF